MMLIACRTVRDDRNLHRHLFAAVGDCIIDGFRRIIGLGDRSVAVAVAQFGLYFLHQARHVVDKNGRRLSNPYDSDGNSDEEDGRKKRRGQHVRQAEPLKRAARTTKDDRIAAVTGIRKLAARMRSTTKRMVNMPIKGT